MDAIADHLWQSTIFAVTAGMMAWAFRRNNASVRYWIWFAAAAKFLAPLTALTAIADQIPLPHAPVSASVALGAATIVFHSSALPHVSGVLATSMLVGWLLGAGAVLTMSARQWHRIAVRARRSAPVLEGDVYDALRFAERIEGIRKPTRIVAASGTLEPGVFGIWKPVLIWPRHLTGALSRAHAETIVAHEVCHIVRRDNLLALVQVVVTAIFWFHPIVWWIGARLVDERERACDERVLALGRPPKTYAESILTTCRLCIMSSHLAVAGVTGGDLKQRIARILHNEPTHPLQSRQKAVLLTAALVVVLLPTAAGVSACQADDGGAKDTQAAVPVQSPPQGINREVHRPGGNVTSPRLIRESKPKYTARAIQEKIQGEVLMECVVKADGTVGEKKVVKSLHPDLDQAALEAAEQWVFEPGKRNGQPVDVLVTVAMAFTLK